MYELRQKERVRRILYSIPALVLLAFIAFVLAKGAIKIIAKEEGSRERVELLREEAQAMALREEMLQKRIARLQTPEGVEEEIKDKFNVVTEGEYVAIIVDEKRVASSTDDTDLPWYKKFFNIIIPKR